MDWERIKNIFILVFMLLNAVFLAQLWLVPTYFDSSMYISSQQVETKLAELQYNNISVDTRVPRRLKRLQMLTVQVPSRDQEAFAAAILGSEAEAVSTPLASGSTKFASPQGEVEFTAKGQIFCSLSRQPGRSELSRRSAKIQAEEFLRRTLGKPRDAKIGRIVQLNEIWAVEYYQRWREKNLDIARITIWLDGTGVLGMEYYWVEVLGFVGEEIVTIPATGALSVAAEKMTAGTVITRIYTSWYSPPVHAEQWRCYPVWVVETADGTKYYINAFTGEFEGQSGLPAGKPGSVLN